MPCAACLKLRGRPIRPRPPAWEAISAKNVCVLGMSKGELWDLLHNRRATAEEPAVRALVRVWLQGGELIAANVSTPEGGRAALWRAAASACKPIVAVRATDVHVRLPTLECLVIGFFSRGARDDFVARFSALRDGGTQVTHP